MKQTYHHGDLANSLVTATVTLLETRAVAQLSLRQVARAAGVSHGAPAHHFGDKAGLLTAVAIQGYQLLAAHLKKSLAPPDRSPEERLLDAGYAYIRFALTHTAHFEVMFQPALTHSRTPAYQAAAQAAKAVLEECIRGFLLNRSPAAPASEKQVQATVIALWSQAHGFADLWLAGNLADTADDSQLDDIILAMLSSITPR